MTEGLRVDFSSEEASSEARSFEPIPGGEYYVKITDVTDREVGEGSKNAGKPYWNIEVTVQDGDYEDRKLWSNCMLFEGALYTLAQVLKATDHHEALETGNIPAGEDLVGKDVIVVVTKQRDTYREEQNGDGTVLWKNEIKGFKPYDESNKAKLKKAGSKGGSLLP